MRLCLMIEGQENVTWEQWLALADACEQHGLEGLFRSDHYLSVFGQLGRGSLDAWATLAGLAARTRRIRLGTLVSPATFRHPSLLAKTAATVDHISGGRVELGLGAGWYEAEHRAFGFEMPPSGTRLDLLAEQLEIVTRSWESGSFSFSGAHYRLEDVNPLPKPLQRPRPTLLVGGAGGPRSAELAARFADEYNTTAATIDDCKQRHGKLASAWQQAGRDPDSLRFSLMTATVVGRDRSELRDRLARVLERTGSGERPEDLLANPPERWIVGTVDEVVERLHALEAAGVNRVMLQHLAHDDLDMVALLGSAVAPAVA